MSYILLTIYIFITSTQTSHQVDTIILYKYLYYLFIHFTHYLMIQHQGVVTNCVYTLHLLVTLSSTLYHIVLTMIY